MVMRLQLRPYAFALTRPLQTAAGAWQQRRGWLLRIEDGCGRFGWGEVSPLTPHQEVRCDRWLIERINDAAVFASVDELEQLLESSPAEVAFAFGAALAELQGLVGERSPLDWLPAPASARLLPAGLAMPAALTRVLEAMPADGALTLKWKVAAAADPEERRLLAWLLEALPSQARLRLDANGGWRLATAEQWAAELQGEPRLEWIEQPLALDDLAGHQHLLCRVPVALDESLRDHPAWRARWSGWQVRRPALEGDPRPLLRQLQQGAPHLMLSTAFETGIGARWLAHLAALQQRGPSPAAPGLAPGWCPEDALFSSDPFEVWTAAGDVR
ncbi:MAG: O-succinylbenzoate synthase [Cyanobacteriota bacterium]|jgi:O-succinylbenzoate synthase